MSKIITIIYIKSIEKRNFKIAISGTKKYARTPFI